MSKIVYTHMCDVTAPECYRGIKEGHIGILETSLIHPLCLVRVLVWRGMKERHIGILETALILPLCLVRVLAMEGNKGRT
jgi:hypothetical protein